MCHMFRKKCWFWLPVAVLVVLFAAPAPAFYIMPELPPATATVSCIGGASLTVNASDLYAGLPYVIDYTITATPASGSPATFSGSINATAGAPETSTQGTISVVSPVSTGYLVGNYTLSGAIQLYDYTGAQVATNTINFNPTSLSCPAPAITQFSVTPSCSGYSITASAANLDPETSYIMPYTITFTPSSGSSVNVSNTISFTADSNGNYNGTGNNSLGPLSGNYTASGSATLSVAGSSTVVASTSIQFSPSSLACPIITGFTVDAGCSSYSVTASASNLTPGGSYTMPFTMTLTPVSGSPTSVSNTISFTANSSGSYSGTTTNSLGPLSGSFSPSGSASLEETGSSTTLASSSIQFAPISVSCQPGISSLTGAVSCSSCSLTANIVDLAPGTNYTMPYTITLTPSSGGSPVTVSNTISFTANSSGSYSASASPSLGYLAGNYTVSGTAQLDQGSSSLASQNISFTPTSLSCPLPAITGFSVTPSCSGYSITASAANLNPGASYTMPYTITLTSSSGGSPVTVSNTISFTAGSSGSYSGTVPLTSFGYLAGNYTISGTVQLKQGTSSLASQSISFSPTSLSCPVPAITQFSVTPSCSGYTITTVSAANLNPGTTYTMPFTVTLTPSSGSAVSASGTLSFTASSSGTYSGSMPLASYTYLVGTYTATGTASLYQSSSKLASAAIGFSPASLTCTMPTACISIKELISTNGGSSYQASETCTNALYAGNDSANYELTVTNCGTDNLEDVLINNAQLGISNFPVGALLVGQSTTYTSSQIPELAVNPFTFNLFNFSDTSIATGTGIVSGTKVTAQDTGCVSCISGGYESGTYPYCIYVLDPSATDALTLQSSTINASCGIIVDSSASQAFLAQSSTVTATEVSITGKYLEQSSTVKPTPGTGVTAEPNPLAYLPAPSYQTCSCTSPTSLTEMSVSSYTIPAGCYSSITMMSVGTVNFTAGTCVTGTITLQSDTTVNFAAGTYVINGVTMQSVGTVNFGAGTYVITGGNAVFQSTSISGSGVMFYINGGALTMQASSTESLSASTSGTYADILFFQNPSDTSQATVQAGTFAIDGVLYFPAAKLVVQGGGGTVTGGIIADEILFQSSNFTVNELPLP